MKKLVGIILNLFGGFWLFFGIVGGIISSNDFTSGTIVVLLGLGIFSLGNKIKQSKTTLWEDITNKVHLDYDKIDQIKQSIFSWLGQMSPLVLDVKKKLLTLFKSFQHHSEDKNKKRKVKPQKIISKKKISPSETIKNQKRNVKNQVVAEIVKSLKEEKIRLEEKGVQNKIDDKIFVKEEQYNTKRYSSKKELFYNESDIILAEYRHLTTPEELLQAIADPNRNSYSYSTLGAKEFIRDSLKYKNSSGSYCEPVELTSYYTTFSDLNNEQKAWYFYWRTNALNLNFLDVDLSYIYLFTYELLNYSFNENTAFNVSMLVHLYEAYKEKYRVDRLKEVIFEMLLELNQTDLTKKWINERYNPALYSNLKEEKEISTISRPFGKHT
ncbi:TerB N-terminal domain-containing protein [Candidatus Enterococcus mansonii]|uniref:TerB N-terminal domain-containing protein n=2 Tax=Candidatus Enterococcus mansonii TaxID=1834181 RepID=A0ABU8IHZ6_9ENTE